MARIDIGVVIDDELVRRVDELAATLGVTRDAVIADAVGKTLEARTVTDAVDRIRRSSPPTPQMAEHLAYEELRAARAERHARRA